LAPRVSDELEAVRSFQEPVEGGVGDGLVAESFVPKIDG
jgi:hypothetical protein